MDDLLLGLQLAIEAAFMLLALAALVDWTRHRDTRRSHLAVAFGSLTALILISPALDQAGPFNQLSTDVAVVFLLLSGYALLMFRASFIPLAATTLRAVRIAILAVAALAIVAQLPADPQQPHVLLQSVALVAVLVTWSLCILEPIFRLWRASSRRPAVESARLRALSLGYAALLAEIGAIHAEVDPDRFQIVVRNLLSNAAKYSPAGARIRVQVSGNGVGKVAVTDEGIGIAEDDQVRLFSRFVRIDTKATERVSGTGLGLWLSREIARMHDGDLTVESTPGRGSTFTLQLPLST
jgi:Histidine kinase-, DNA gyrase B-, and HSP90-like ATPase